MKAKKDIDIDEFLKLSPVIPCFLISKDNGRIEISIDGFDKKKIPIEKIKENYFKIIYQEESEESQIILDKNISSDISIYGNNLSFNSKAKKDKRNREDNKFLVGEYKLYSLNIREEDLSFSKYYKDKFERIANTNCSDEEKAKEIEEIFTSIGYYIPKKIYIGGMLINKVDKIKGDKIAESINTLGANLSFNKNIKIGFGANFSSNNK